MTKQEIIDYMYENHVQGDFKIEEMAEDLAQPEIIRCKDCSKRDTDECPMRHVEWIEYDDDGWLESDDVVYDNTVDDGYCHKGKLGGDSDEND